MFGNLLPFMKHFEAVRAVLLGANKKPSSLGFKYPTFRDHPLRSTTKWLEGKRRDDGAEGLWRIHDGLYDLTPFISQHPGGQIWLKLTEGTDVTEAFESHHIGGAAELLLPRFFVRNALTRRNSPFHFRENGFYRTLKRDITTALETAPTWPEQRTKLITDLLLLIYLTSSFLAIYLGSMVLGAISGIVLANLAIAAHNFFHKKDNFRMYYFDLSLFSSQAWRVSHALSHHMYTNTINDFEISGIEPFLQYLPEEKTVLAYLSCVYLPIVMTFISLGNCVLEVAERISSKKGLPLTYLLPFTIPISVTLFSGTPLLWGMSMFIWILVIGSLYFGVIGINAAHHHPEIFHDGDAPRPSEELDWGIHQLDAVMDRHEVTGSPFLVLTNFGDHALHHLFPTIDHGLLEFLYPTFKDTCEKFGVEWRMTSQFELVRGQFRQLVKHFPNPVPPPRLKVITVD